MTNVLALSDVDAIDVDVGAAVIIKFDPVNNK